MSSPDKAQSRNPVLQESNNQLELMPDLALFCEVVRAGSLRAAAEVRDITPSTVTRAIQRLEKALVMRLFVRTTRSLTLTEEGRGLYEACLPGVLTIENAFVAALRSQAATEGSVRVTCATNFGRRHIAPLVHRFIARHPQIGVELILEDAVRNLGTDGFDLAIRGGRFGEERVIAKRIADMPMYICGSPAYLARAGVPRQPSDLMAHQCIRYFFAGTRKELLWEFRQGEELVPLGVPGTYVVNNIEVACQAACEGLGLAQLPGYVAVPEIMGGRLAPMLLHFLDASRAFYLCYQDRLERLPRRVQLLANFLIAEIGPATNFTLMPQERDRYAA